MMFFAALSVVCISAVFNTIAYYFMGRTNLPKYYYFINH